MTNAAKKYAAKHGLPWPVQVPKAPPAEPKPKAPTRMAGAHAQQEAAYKARCEGHAWAEAAKLGGYTHPGHAVTGAKKHAARHGLDWPIKPLKK